MFAPSVDFQTPPPGRAEIVGCRIAGNSSGRQRAAAAERSDGAVLHPSKSGSPSFLSLSPLVVFAGGSFVAGAVFCTASDLRLRSFCWRKTERDKNQNEQRKRRAANMQSLHHESCGPRETELVSSYGNATSAKRTTRASLAFMPQRTPRSGPLQPCAGVLGNAFSRESESRQSTRSSVFCRQTPEATCRELRTRELISVPQRTRIVNIPNHETLRLTSARHRLECFKHFSICLFETRYDENETAVHIATKSSRSPESPAVSCNGGTSAASSCPSARDTAAFTAGMSS